METQNRTLLTYFGLDGACSAASLLRQWPETEIRTTSARAIADDIAQCPANHEVHICGVGIACGREALEAALAEARDHNLSLTWHCGREYLNAWEELITEYGSAEFSTHPTNTEALGAPEDLVSLAEFDKNLPNITNQKPDADQSEWIDLVDAAIAEYLKFGDPLPYVRCIRALAAQSFTEECQNLVQRFRRAGWKHMLHGRTKPVRELKRRIQRCAEADRAVMILGESGVGKEHVAHLLWERSKRAFGPFVPVNCATFTGNPGLANADLFGHVKGAFTGADRDRPGRFAEADGGMLFMDELSELPLEVQAKILRVLEDGWITPEGADKPTRQVDVRVIAATNADISDMVRNKTFRADLFHRLSALPLRIPPLRERREDINEIIDERLAVLAAEGYAGSISRADRARLQEYDWPGNVRQLIKVIERGIILEEKFDAILADERAVLGTADDTATEKDRGVLMPASVEEALSMTEVQRRYARHVWELCGGSFAAAARALDVTTTTLRYSYLGMTRPGSDK